MDDSITRENRLNLLLAVRTKTHNELTEAFYSQENKNLCEVLRAKENLISELLLDSGRVIPIAILIEAKSIMPQ